jgi:hypothetical protein
MKLIDADALHEIRFTDIFNENVRHSKSKLYMLGWNDAIDAIIYDTPTVDAVPVIRCKDCKHWDRNDGMFKDFDGRQWHHCPHLGIDTDGYFSCIEGKRKEE